MTGQGGLGDLVIVPFFSNNSIAGLVDSSVTY